MTFLFRLPPFLRHGTAISPWCSFARRGRVCSTTSARNLSTERAYANALELLESLQSNRAIVSSISDTSRDLNLDAIPEMLDWTQRAGYDVRDFARRGLRCVHVAGTKGKGSVCVMVENLLLQYRDINTGQVEEVRHCKKRGLGKIGLYTSPHLVTVRERIRIDGSPISEDLFTRYFFELWDRFSNAASLSSPKHVSPISPDGKPGYFRFLTLLAFHAFLGEKVETAIIECGIGGEYDSTNILPPEAVSVCAITRLGIDHIGMLGETIEEIAWHKAGIMKAAVPAFTIMQSSAALSVLRERAVEKGAELTVVKRYIGFDHGGVKLGLEGDFQKDNASLAIAVAACHLRNMGIQDDVPLPNPISASREQLPTRFTEGLMSVKWQGRCEVRREGNIDWLIDGAHTEDSIEATAKWYSNKFQEASEHQKPPTETILIFNQQSRNAEPLIRKLITTITSSTTLISTANSPPRKVFTHAIFCSNNPFKAHALEQKVDLQSQYDTAKLYSGLDVNTSPPMVYESISEAVEFARHIADGHERVLVLVTGSLYLVGGFLQVLEKQARHII